MHRLFVLYYGVYQYTRHKELLFFFSAVCKTAMEFWEKINDILKSFLSTVKGPLHHCIRLRHTLNVFTFCLLIYANYYCRDDFGNLISIHSVETKTKLLAEQPVPEDCLQYMRQVHLIFSRFNVANLSIKLVVVVVSS